MAAFRFIVVFCFFLVFPFLSHSLPEPGKVMMTFSKTKGIHGFPKALYKGAVISVKGKCSSTKKPPPKVKISWRLKYAQCADVFLGFKDDVLINIWDRFRNYELSGVDFVECKSPIQMKDHTGDQEYLVPEEEENLKQSNKTKGEIDAKKREQVTDGKEEPQQTKAKMSKQQQEKAIKQQDKETQKKQDTKNTVTKTQKGNTLSKKTTSTNNKIKKDKDSTTRIKRDVSNEDEIQEEPLPEGNELEDLDDKSDSAAQPQKVETNKVNPKPAAAEHPQPDSKKAKLSKKQPKNKKVNKKETDSEKKTLKGKKDEEKAPVKTLGHPAKKKKATGRITTTQRDGIYILIISAESIDDTDFQLEVEVSMESKSGYLSATDWPLLPFYGVMSLVYLFYGIIWLIISACQWRDLLRIQFWIGGVIALGMLEKAVFYSEYNNINHTGIPNPSLVVFAELVSVGKRTLARMLVIIVSMGFGIVKPRLGKSLHRVLGVGALYFIIGIVEGCLRSLSVKADPSKEQLIAGIPLAVLDAAICWWIFMSLVQTTRTLRIRRNVIKLSLYRHFTNTLIFAVLASVAYMIWSIKTHKFADCLKDWSELWLDEAFWHFLFSIILLVIMVLWRPTANNQRYAFTPIVDFDDDEEDNVTLSEAFDGMKMRNTKTEVVINGDSKRRAEDDLKWVEENIPSSAADTVLPSVLDSDEELMTTKFEMSKME